MFELPKKTTKLRPPVSWHYRWFKKGVFSKYKFETRVLEMCLGKKNLFTFSGFTVAYPAW